MRKILISLFLTFHLIIATPVLVTSQDIITYQTESESLEERREKGLILINELRLTRRIIGVREYLSKDKDVYQLFEKVIDRYGNVISVYYYITITDTEINLRMETY